MKIILGLFAAGVIAAVIHYALKSNRPDEKKPEFLKVNETELKGLARTNLDSPAPTEAQLSRKRKFTTLIAGMGVPTLESLPVTEDEKSIRPRTASEIVSRALCVAICAVKGESKDAAFADKLISEYGVSDKFTGKESAFVRSPRASDRENSNYTWQDERADVLLWALGYVDRLKPPNETCDTAQVVRAIKKKSVQSLIEGAKLRRTSEILDMADYYYRLQWSAVELRITGKKTERINEEITMERLCALNWLIRYMNQEWDDITTDT